MISYQAGFDAGLGAGHLRRRPAQRRGCHRRSRGGHRARRECPGDAHGRGGRQLHRPSQLPAANRHRPAEPQGPAAQADLTRQRFQGGFVSGLDVANADAQVATTAAQIPVLEKSAQQAIYSLSVLLGREPGALLAESDARRPLCPPRRRPCPWASRPTCSAAARTSARPRPKSTPPPPEIGVATADLFPTFRFTGDCRRPGQQIQLRSATGSTASGRSARRRAGRSSPPAARSPTSRCRRPWRSSR